MKKIKLVKPYIKNNKARNTTVKLYAYIRESGGKNIFCKPPVVNSVCGFRHDK